LADLPFALDDEGSFVCSIDLSDSEGFGPFVLDCLCKLDSKVALILGGSQKEPFLPIGWWAEYKEVEERAVGGICEAESILY
jgi:hypothetical protein